MSPSKLHDTGSSRAPEQRAWCQGAPGPTRPAAAQGHGGALQIGCGCASWCCLPWRSLPTMGVGTLGVDLITILAYLGVSAAQQCWLGGHGADCETN